MHPAARECLADTIETRSATLCSPYLEDVAEAIAMQWDCQTLRAGCEGYTQNGSSATHSTLDTKGATYVCADS